MPDTVPLSHSVSIPLPSGGTPVIILHGLFGSKRNWGAVTKTLSETRQVFSLDMRNHGESPWSDDMNYTVMADDVAAFMDSLSIPKADVIGHSMGGKAAMVLALNHPDKVQRLIVVDIAPVPSPGTFIHYVKALSAMDLLQVSNRKEADAQLALTEANPGIRAFLLQNLETVEDGFRWRVNLETLANCMQDLLDFPHIENKAFSRRTLFLAGGASDYVDLSHHAEINRLFPNAMIETLPGIGHWVHAQAPDLFLQHVRHFLDGPN